MLPEIDSYLSANAARFEDELCELLRIPSVSADSTRKGEVRRAAEWVAAQFRGLGLQVEMCETAGYPIVFAEAKADPSKPTVMTVRNCITQVAKCRSFKCTDGLGTFRFQILELFARLAWDRLGEIFSTTTKRAITGDQHSLRSSKINVLSV